MLGHVYLNLDTDSYVLSLGFLKYCVLALRLTKKVLHGAAYFFVNMTGDSKLPTMVFNVRPGRDSTWRHVPCEVVPPICACASAVCLKQKGTVVEGLLPSALMTKVFLTKPQLEKCLQSEGIPFPAAGPKGRVLKRDIAQALVDHVLADRPEDVRARVLNRLARDSAPEPDEDDMEDCPIEILQVINEMDRDNKDHFEGVLKQAAGLLVRRVQAETERNAQRRAGQQQPRGAAGGGAAEAPAHQAAAAEPAAANAAEAAAPAAGAANAAEAAAPDAGAAANAPEAEPRDDGSPRRRANLGRAKAPEEFRSLLPPLNHLHFYYQPRQRRVVVEFASI